MTKQTKNNNVQGKALVELYDKITCLEQTYKEMQQRDLERLSAEMYNAVVQELNPKRKVLLNELLDAEVELRLRTTQ